MASGQTITEDAQNVMHLAQEDLRISQRLIAKKPCLSIRKVNYCLKAQTDIGYIKLHKFGNPNTKTSCANVLTPKDIREKISLTKKFIDKKLQEFDKLNLYIYI